ncbi:MAG: hypothetical protein J6S40_00870 [Thermoguttaceae bacterium]|nr:hypothetical protein [Thermoguttaceae bacterium]
MPATPDEEFDLPMWKVVLKHLLRPRTWIYPIIILIVVYFILPRLAPKTPPPNGGANETILFGGGENPGPAETVDEEGNIHRFVIPEKQK